MPEWVSHVLIGLIFAEIFKIKKKSLIVLGSLLPDFVVKIYLVNYFLYVGDPILFISQLYHSPIMGLIIPALIVPFFRYDWKKTYLCIMSGFMLHIFADSFTKQYYDGVLLYPFSHSFFSFNLIWGNQYWLVLIPLAIVYAAIKLYQHRFKAKKR